MTAPVGDDLTWLDDLQRAHAAATPGPWRQLLGDVYGTDPERERGFGPRIAVGPGGATVAEADAALIVAAVNAVPRVAAELRKRDAALRAVAELADRWRVGLHILDEIDRFEVVRGLDDAITAAEED